MKPTLLPLPTWLCPINQCLQHEQNKEQDKEEKEEKQLGTAASF